MEYFAVQAPSDASDYAVKVTLQSDHTSVATQSLLSVKPKASCYSADIALQNNAVAAQLCNATTVPVTIKNTGEKNDKYTLSLHGPSWAYISPNVVDLPGGQQQQVYIYFSPCFGVEKKVYHINLTASSPSFQAVKDIAVGVVENVTGGGGGITPPPSGNETNVTGGGNVTGNLILGLDTNQWKLVAIIIITLIIIIILAIRFIMLAKK
jgi:uncharacterized membrane protein